LRFFCGWIRIDRQPGRYPPFALSTVSRLNAFEDVLSDAKTRFLPDCAHFRLCLKNQEIAAGNYSKEKVFW
jgi:hypothetical protein